MKVEDFYSSLPMIAAGLDFSKNPDEGIQSIRLPSRSFTKHIQSELTSAWSKIPSKFKPTEQDALICTYLYFFLSSSTTGTDSLILGNLSTATTRFIETYSNVQKIHVSSEKKVKAKKICYLPPQFSFADLPDIKHVFSVNTWNLQHHLHAKPDEKIKPGTGFHIFSYGSHTIHPASGPEIRKMSKLFCEQTAELTNTKSDTPHMAFSMWVSEVEDEI